MLLDCFHNLAIVNNVLQILELMYNFELVFLFSSRVKLLDHEVILGLFFEDPSYCFAYWLYHSTFPPASSKGSFFPHLPRHFISDLFDDSMWSEILHCSLDLHFSSDLEC